MVQPDDVLLGRYKIRFDIGPGRIGRIFAVLDQQDQSRSRVKVIKVLPMVAGEQFLDDPQTYNEFDFLNHLRGTIGVPNIIQHFQVGRERVMSKHI